MFLRDFESHIDHRAMFIEVNEADYLESKKAKRFAYTYKELVYL